MIKDILKQIRDRSENEIYIYGAGLYGKTLFRYLEMHKVENVSAFIVSKKSEQHSVLGKKVISIDDFVLESKKNALIIVAASECYAHDMIKNLEENDYINYIVFGTEEYNLIKNEVVFEEQRVVKNNIAVLLYHRINNGTNDFWKLNITTETFEKHVKFLAENYHVISLDDDWSLIDSNEKNVVITFDDGYVDNYRNAKPILEKYRVPATIFVPTDLIDTKNMYWWDELEKILLIDQYRGTFKFEGVIYDITNNEDSKKACLDIRNKIKMLNRKDRIRKLDYLRNILNVKVPTTDELRCITSDELREMAESEYISIGGHTKSHISLSEDKREDELNREITESIQILREKTGHDIVTFAYPFGGVEDRSKKSENILQKNNIKKNVIVENRNTNIQCDMYSIPRYVMMEEDDIDKKMNRIWGIYG